MIPGIFRTHSVENIAKNGQIEHIEAQVLAGESPRGPCQAESNSDQHIAWIMGRRRRRRSSLGEQWIASRKAGVDAARSNEPSKKVQKWLDEVECPNTTPPTTPSALMSPALLLGPSATQGDPETLPDVLSNAPHDILTSEHDLYASALAVAKTYLDPLASATSQRQEQRLEESRRKRKRGKHDDGEFERSVLKLKEIHLDGFTCDGVVGQTKRVLDANFEETERFLREQELDQAQTRQDIKSVRFDKQGFEVGSDDDEAESGSDAEDDLEDDDHDMQEFGDAFEQFGSEDEEENVEEDGDEDVDEDEDGLDEDLEDIEADSADDDDDGESSQPRRSGVLVKDKFGLNDGFFDIDEFNKDSEFLEQADERGDDDGAASDEEDVDWDADPLGQSLAPSTTMPSKKGKEKQAIAELDDDDDDEEEQADGPTFGDADLDAPWSDDEDEEGEKGDLDMEDQGPENTNEVRYNDFFEPPPQAYKQTKKRRALPKTQPDDKPTKPADYDLERAIESHKLDLFEDEAPDPNDSAGEEIDEDAPGMRNLSTHERRRVVLAKQIRELEAASVQKREWQLSGEATAHARPENALLEEDLEFERAGKPVPVITADVSTSIEDMIKQRILNRQFDEVIKRRPGTDVGSVLGGGQPRRGLLELSDQKDPQGLGEQYEQAYLAQNDPDAKDPRSEALKAQHAEIEKLWSEVSGKLDALTSWRYKPKPPGVEVRVVTDAPKVLMEDARPSGVEGINEEQGGLAPQEVYRVGEDRQAGDEGVVTTRAGAVVAKEELTREQKLRRRRREKERTKKQQSNEAAKAAEPKAKQDAVPVKKSKRDDEAEVLKTLKAGGVQVIGKGGKLEGVDDKKSKRS